MPGPLHAPVKRSLEASAFHEVLLPEATGRTFYVLSREEACHKALLDLFGL